MEENIIVELPIKMFDILEEIASSEGLFLDEFVIKNLAEMLFEKYQIDYQNL